MFSLEKVDNLRAKEREEKETTNSAPREVFKASMCNYELLHTIIHFSQNQKVKTIV